MQDLASRTAHQVASALKNNGVPYLFGIPGGGSSIDLIEACKEQDIPFVLVQHETTAAMMAVVVGELTDTCGACISIMGPGATNLVSGAIYAQLERHPLLCFTETYGPAEGPLTSMQNIDHPHLFGSLSKGSFCITAADPAGQIDRAIQIANAPCSWGVLEFDHTPEPIRAAQVLDEIAATGYAGTELGDYGFLPTDPAALRDELVARELSLVGAFVPVALARAEPLAGDLGRVCGSPRAPALIGPRRAVRPVDPGSLALD